ncbi:MAG: hypothetical protein ASARMPRED_003546 [Alectoria sarmentosa]|nr:MAG: hypothetical protein ASARMPRED_003546 [Alectoria sarmentosa]
MAAFSDLPNELLYDVLQQCMPEDLENFAQISKRVQAVAKPLLQTHRALIRKYRCFDNRLYGRAAVASLLLDILTTPHIAHYVREAKVDLSGRYRREEFTQQEIGWLCNLAAESEWLLSGVDATDIRSLQSEMKYQIENHCQDTALALLLPLLPNLETFWIDAGDIRSRYWIEYVIGNAPKAKKPFFTKLARVHLTFGGFKSTIGYGCSVDYERFRYYAALPSIKEMSAPPLTLELSCCEKDAPPLVSEITKLELVDSAIPCRLGEELAIIGLDWINPKHLYGFLDHLPKLEVFSYATKTPMIFSEFNAPLIRDALITNVKSSLRALTILGPIDYPGFMSSLREFEVLTVLRTQWSLLVKNDCNLQAVLPVSLHVLQLDDKIIRCKRIYKRLMENAVSGNLSGDLQLEYVTLIAEDVRKLEETCHDLQQKCRVRGLMLTLTSPLRPS